MITTMKKKISKKFCRIRSYNKEKENIVQYLVEHGADMDKTGLRANNSESEATFWDFRFDMTFIDF